MGVSRRYTLGVGLGLAGGVAVGPALAGAAEPAAVGCGAGLPWPQARRIVARTRVPHFPGRVFNVLDFGAVGDGTTDNTAAIAAAIDACHRRGGGRVLVPAGTYLTGAVYLKSHVDLHLDAGATLSFSGDVTRYPTVLTRYEGIECMNH